MGWLFSSSAKSSSSTANYDNKNVVESGGSAVSGTGNTLNVQSADALSLAGGAIGASLDTINEQVDRGYTAFEKLVESTNSVNNAVNSNARDALEFVQQQSTTDFVQLFKDLAPYVAGAFVLYKAIERF